MLLCIVLCWTSVVLSLSMYWRWWMTRVEEWKYYVFYITLLTLLKTAH